MLHTLLDFLFPQSSSQSKNAQLPFLPYRETDMSLTKRGLGSLDSLLSAMQYSSQQNIAVVIGLFKYKKMSALTQQLARYIVAASKTQACPKATLVPVPLYWKRRVQRGFNQSALLAKAVGMATGLPVQNILRRTKDTGHQARRSRYERMVQMQGAFMVKKNKQLPLHVILIDDIATTGATLDACAETLKHAGVKQVDAWVIARV